MLTLSTFQTLPLHIAEAIAAYCVSNYRFMYDGYDAFMKQCCRTWEAFYGVSNLWRVLALSRFCKKLDVPLTGWPSREVSFTDLSPSIEVHKHFYNYVRSVSLSTGSYQLKPYSEMAEHYNKVWPKDVTLRSASQLTVYLALNPFDCTTVDSHVEYEKLIRILELVRTSMPKLREVHIDIYKTFDYWPDHSAEITEPKLECLLVDIISRASNLVIRTWPALLDGGDAQLLNGSLIASLNYTIRGDMDYFAVVLQRLGSTLESLEIKHFPPQSIKALVFNSDGSPIVYSQLKRLIFSILRVPGQTTTAPRIGLIASPFPSLRYLKWMAEYPFEYDLIFRGSHDTLEHLDIKFDRAALDILERHAMAFGGRYTRLRHLSMRIDSVMVDVVTDYGRLLEFGANFISPVTHTFETDSHCSWQQVLDTFSTCPYTENIRVLSLEGTELGLLEILDLVKLLPNMTDFVCRFTGIGTNIRHRNKQTVADHLYPDYYPLSHRLKFWEVKGGLPRVPRLVTTAIALAVLCPNFKFVTVPSSKIDEYQAKLKATVGSKRYRGHQDRLNCLISRKQK